jgi:hypothetical protein
MGLQREVNSIGYIQRKDGYKDDVGWGFGIESWRLRFD